MKSKFPSLNLNFVLFPKSHSTWKIEFRKCINAIFKKEKKKFGMQKIIQYRFETTYGTELVFEKESSAINEMEIGKEYVLFPGEDNEKNYPAEVGHELTFDEEQKKIIRVVHGKRIISKGNPVYFIKQKMIKAGWTFIEETKS